VKINLHHHLLQNRRNAVRSADRPASERLAFKLWRWTMMGSQRFAFVGSVARMLLRAAYGWGLARTPLDPMRPWTKVHGAPEIPAKSFRALWKEQHGAS
jgi:L-lactate dehydrogenase complex protein LldF